MRVPVLRWAMMVSILAERRICSTARGLVLMAAMSWGRRCSPEISGKLSAIAIL
ncbi:MAG: hypothetical protein ACK53P_09830 [Pseudanabaena sp.]